MSVNKNSNVSARANCGKPSLGDVIYILIIPLGFALPRLLTFKGNYKLFKIISLPSFFYDSILMRFLVLYIETAFFLLLAICALLALLYLFVVSIGKSSKFVFSSNFRNNAAAWTKYIFSNVYVYGQRFVYSLCGSTFIAIGIGVIVIDNAFNIIAKPPTTVLVLTLVLFVFIFTITRGKIHEQNKGRIDPRIITTVDCLVILFLLWTLFTKSYYKDVSQLTMCFTSLAFIQTISANIVLLIHSIKNGEINFHKIVTQFITYVFSAIILFGLAYKTTCLSINNAAVLDLQNNGRVLYSVDGKYLASYKEWQDLDSINKETLNRDNFKILYYSFCCYFGYNAEGFESRGYVRVVSVVEIIYAYIINILIVSYGISMLVTYELKKRNRRPEKVKRTM